MRKFRFKVQNKGTKGTKQSSDFKIYHASRDFTQEYFFKWFYALPVMSRIRTYQRNYDVIHDGLATRPL